MLVDFLDIHAREILDSRGSPTIEVEVTLSDNSVGIASVPSGASVGSREAIELRDEDPKRYGGKGVLKAINNVNNEIADSLYEIDPLNQAQIDERLIKIDGTENKSKYGANALLGVSLAASKAAACSFGMPLYRYLGGVMGSSMPTPMINVINGGLHADNDLPFQEIMIVPVGAKEFCEAIRMSSEVFHALKLILKKHLYRTNVGDEGGFAPDVKNIEESLDLITSAIELAGYSMPEDFLFALDVAGSELYTEDKMYNFSGMHLSSSSVVDYYESLVSKYPIISIEDPMSEVDLEGWRLVTKRLGSRVQIVGDDVFVTNSKLIEEGISMGIANAVLIKPNQVGTVTETIEAIKTSRKGGYETIISHRSGETEDSYIAHLAVATNCSQIKTGSMSRSDRIAKYNELLRIEENLSSSSKFGHKFSF